MRARHLTSIAGATILSSLVFAVASSSAFADKFDGNWVGQVPPIDKCNQQSIMTITIAGDQMAGQVQNPGNVRMLKGQVDAGGNGTFFVAGPQFRGTMKFTDDHFEGDWFNGNCTRHVLGDRAPDAAETAALMEQRKQAQAVYGDLTAKAASGTKVDYAALRAAYPFTKQWDVFGNKTGPMMEQARIASKGGDCTTAIAKLDDLLKIDFTFVAAHKMRSDCLRDTGKRDEARMETAIADGLENSMTAGRDGDTEKTAYPVMTTHEEMDILADKHIVLKTRQIEIRSSDGHFYDVAHGVSLRNNGNGTVAAGLHDVYFDVTAQVKARRAIIAASSQSAAAQ